jgi:hypothetical protein
VTPGGRKLLRTGRAGQGCEGAFRDHGDSAALAVAGEVALDVNGGTGCELGEVGDVEGSEDDPVAVNPLAGGVAPGEKEEAEITGRADGAGEAGHQADEARPVHCGAPSSALP